MEVRRHCVEYVDVRTSLVQRYLVLRRTCGHVRNDRSKMNYACPSGSVVSGDPVESVDSLEGSGSEMVSSF